MLTTFQFQKFFVEMYNYKLKLFVLVRSLNLMQKRNFCARKLSLLRNIS